MAPAPAGRISWRTLGASVRGASHIRRNQPNQDAILYKSSDSSVILAVADGHGSPACFRSAVGAQLAVEAAAAALAEWPRPEPGEVVARWRAAVLEHMASEPDARASLRAYGSTLLAVRATASEVLCLQLGDGDILAVADGGGVERLIPTDSVAGLETASLCLDDAAEWMRMNILEGPLPALIMLSTDGYANSFRDDGEFMRAAPDFLALIRESGPQQVAGRLEPWLTEVSAYGSGDDVTVGLLFAEIEEHGASSGNG